MTEQQFDSEKTSFYNSLKKVCVLGQIYIFTMMYVRKYNELK